MNATSPTDLRALSLKQAADALAAKQISAVELTDALLKAATDNNPAINGYITICADHAREAAKASDQRRAKGEKLGLMEGLPIANKDLFCTKDIQTTAASKILDGFVPPYSSTVTENLAREGAIMLGKANLDEFAMGSANSHSHYGQAVNPWGYDKGSQKVPGGSSGGSASVVAAGMALAATGTDTGGSIRQPAAFCGITGVKPSYGRCSRFGIIAFASSLDQAGPLTKTVEDSALMLQAMAGYDPKDSTSAALPPEDFVAACAHGVKGKKIGIPKEFERDDLDGEITAAWQQAQEWLKAAGAEIVPVSLPHAKYALPAYYIIAPAEASANLARYDGVRYGFRAEGAKDLVELYEQTRSQGFGEEVKRRILIGTYVLSHGYYDAYYLQAQKIRRLIHDDFVKAYQSCDVILGPATPTTAFNVGENEQDPLTMYLNDIFTVPVNLAGLPGMALPTHLSKAGLPIGLQLIGPRFGEASLFAAGKVIEEAANFPFLAPFQS